ncbi:MAG: hypothetical protein ACOC5T_10225 [Elusimicrobiota bacterium]
MAKKNMSLSKISKNLINFPSNTKIVKSNCKLCNSKHREKAENEFEKTSGNIKAVKRVLDNENEKISYLSIRNHMYKHYLGEIRINGLKDLVDDIKHFSIKGRDGKDLLIERINLLRREMYLIAENSDNVDIEDRRKNADIIKKLSDGISSLEDKIKAIEGERSLVERLFNSLSELIQDKIKTSNSKEVKSTLIEFLQDFSAITENLMIEDKD